MRIIDLAGIWTLEALSPMRSSGIAQGRCWDMSIPGSIHDTLLGNGIIEEPYDGTEISRTSWIEESAWKAEARFTVAKGSDSFLWNGHTTLEANSRFICLDTHGLQNASDNVKRTQYLNLLSWCWEQMSRDRNERCLLVCDEAYLMIDPQVPQSLVFLRNVEKRARKYEAGLAIISHSVVDFLAPEVKMYGQALLDIPCYKILMGCDGKNLQETKDLYNLTDAEQELLESKRRGHALFIIGSKRLHVNFEIPAYKFSYMGKAGGR